MWYRCSSIPLQLPLSPMSAFALLYLFHPSFKGLFFVLAHRGEQLAPTDISLLSAAWISTFVFCWLLYRYVESPAQRFGHMSCTRFRRHQVRCFMEQEVCHGEKAVYPSCTTEAGWPGGDWRAIAR
jgi:hypothetical protein